MSHEQPLDVGTEIFMSREVGTRCFTYGRERMIPKGQDGKIEAVKDGCYVVYFPGCPFASGRFDVPFDAVAKRDE